jgi:hypothetical protein
LVSWASRPPSPPAEVGADNETGKRMAQEDLAELVEAAERS